MNTIFPPLYGSYLAVNVHISNKHKKRVENYPAVHLILYLYHYQANSDRESGSCSTPAIVLLCVSVPYLAVIDVQIELCSFHALIKISAVILCVNVCVYKSENMAVDEDFEASCYTKG